MKTQTTPDERWVEVVAVEREIRLMAYTCAGDPKLVDNMKMYALWAGRLQKAIGDEKTN
jgi:hypothetical protein